MMQSALQNDKLLPARIREDATGCVPEMHLLRDSSSFISIDVRRELSPPKWALPAGRTTK